MYFLPEDNLFFPHPLLVDEEGVLAFGSQINAANIITAYAHGLFPWYSGHPIFWWNPNPRCVLFPKELKIHKSMRPYFNQEKFTVSYNQCFSKVIELCRDTKRKDQNGSWLNDELIEVFTHLHHKGICQSVEVWEDDELVGGLYGLLLGKIFFGESMFAKKPNASKFGFIKLVQKLEKEEILLIDCQQETGHLKSLGAKTISKHEFWKYIKENLKEVLGSVNCF